MADRSDERAPLDQLLLDLRDLGWLTPSDSLLLTAQNERLQAEVDDLNEEIMSCNAEGLRLENERLRKALTGLLRFAEAWTAEFYGDDGNNLSGEEMAALDAAHKAVLSGSSTLAEKHQAHYRSCGCLGDSAICCDPTCECHEADVSGSSAGDDE